MKTGPLFLKLRECNKKIVVLQGGGDAGKTITALQHIATVCRENRNLIATVVGSSVPNLKGGALRSFQMYVQKDFWRHIEKYNETTRTYYFRNGSIIEFKSYQDELTARGSERHILFMNEANSETFETFWQLQRKTRLQVIIDYNPTSPFWAHERLLSGTDKEFAGRVQLYIVDHRHNPFLSQEEHDNYENISDADMFRVYSRGMTGKIKGLIFAHFKPVEHWGLRQEYDRVIWGIDYGYTNDPTALLKIGVKGRKRVAKELCYEPGITAEALKNIFMFNDLQPSDVIYSEADPNMINQLRVIGMPVYPAIKGPGSIAAGISKTKEHECFYTKDSTNFEKEIMNWKWLTAQDMLTGKEVMTNVPVDSWNHLCDAFRMADYTDAIRHR